jgi:hypothetical protein
MIKDQSILDFPIVVSLVCFIVLWLSVYFGAFCRRRLAPLEKDERDDLGVIQAAALTLLGLLIGFTFSMAIDRHEQRKNYEEAEANAIGTEFVRADLLPAEDASRIRELLKSYLNQRILFYGTRDSKQLRQINAATNQLQNELWAVVQARAATQPTPIVALAVSGMNDVLNSQGYTQAAWWNRIPFEAWVLLVAIAIGCNLLLGYGAHRISFLFIVLPIAVSVSFLLIADIDSPRSGVIHVKPLNLVSLSETINAH